MEVEIETRNSRYTIISQVTNFLRRKFGFSCKGGTFLNNDVYAFDPEPSRKQTKFFIKMLYVSVRFYELQPDIVGIEVKYTHRDELQNGGYSKLFTLEELRADWLDILEQHKFGLALSFLVSVLFWVVLILLLW